MGLTLTKMVHSSEFLEELARIGIDHSFLQTAFTLWEKWEDNVITIDEKIELLSINGKIIEQMRKIVLY